MDISQLPTIVGQTIDTLASKLAVPTQQLLDMAVNGTRAEGIVGLVFTALGLIFIGVSIKMLLSDKNDFYNGNAHATISVIMGIISILVFIGCLFGGYNSAIAAFAPEYSILKTILKF